MELLPVGTRFTFISPYEYGPNSWSVAEFVARHNTEAEVIEHIKVENGPHEGWDDEVLPVYRIRFLSDGAVIEAWPEEVERLLQS